MLAGVVTQAFLPLGPSTTLADESEIESTAATSQGIAVVELFTSEGCSSCPPADVALQQIASIADKNNLPIHVLSFHVDYWNRLGWTDPFSAASHTRRQQSYAGLAGSSRVYTPQMIINGTTEFVGSDRAKANAAIPKALQETAVAKIALEQTPNQSGSGWTVRYQVDGANPGDVLNVALVDTPDVTSVPRGENAGRQLRHINVVRHFETIKIDSSNGALPLDAPEGFKGTDSQIIAFVQDPRTGQITGASAIAL